MECTNGKLEAMDEDTLSVDDTESEDPLEELIEKFDVLTKKVQLVLDFIQGSSTVSSFTTPAVRLPYRSVSMPPPSSLSGETVPTHLTLSPAEIRALTGPKSNKPTSSITQLEAKLESHCRMSPRLRKIGFSLSSPQLNGTSTNSVPSNPLPTEIPKSSSPIGIKISPPESRTT